MTNASKNLRVLVITRLLQASDRERTAEEATNIYIEDIYEEKGTFKKWDLVVLRFDT